MGGLNQTVSGSGKTLWVTTLQRFRATGARQARDQEPQGGIPCLQREAQVRQSPAWLRRWSRVPSFDPGAGGNRLKATGKLWSWGTSRQPRQKPWVGKSREGRNPQAPAGQAPPVGLQGVRGPRGPLVWPLRKVSVSGMYVYLARNVNLQPDSLHSPPQTTKSRGAKTRQPFLTPLPGSGDALGCSPQGPAPSRAGPPSCRVVRWTAPGPTGHLLLPTPPEESTVLSVIAATRNGPPGSPRR